VPSEVLGRSAADGARRAIDHNIILTIDHGHRNRTRVGLLRRALASRSGPQ
jgi:hypothetical protein